ncbi:UNVERIFIED_CONTAM: hypothetical protein Slati_2179200 [Sesamum latifolium]|uniref:Uncharacterized protein n=1 Tax=Sesamum latifolium TaxID=2727402 RepID=A0AAW2WSD4_9LAMI
MGLPHHPSYQYWRNSFLPSTWIRSSHPAEVIEPTKRVLSYEEQENNEARQLDLDLVEEQRDIVRMRLENYKRRILRSYNSRVKERTLQIGDLVLRKVEVQKPVGKLEPKWRTLPSH